MAFCQRHPEWDNMHSPPPPPPAVSPQNGVWGTRAEILQWWPISDQGSAFDWDYLCYERNVLQPIRSTSLTWAVTCHQYGISALFPQTPFPNKTLVASCGGFAGKSVEEWFTQINVWWTHVAVGVGHDDQITIIQVDVQVIRTGPKPWAWQC